MYTLEDDEETSSRLRKSDISGAQSAQAGTPDTTGVIDMSDMPTIPMVSQRVSRKITRSFRQLTTPSKGSGGAGINQKAALAALTVACIGVFLTALDQTVVVTALPQIISDMQIPITQLDHAAWIVSAYLLGFVVAMPLMGRVSDIHGRRRIFNLCLVIFGVGSIFCALAPFLGSLIDLSFLSALGIDVSSPGLIWLIAARFFQAIGGGAVVPVAMAIASDFYGQARRGLALGIIGAVTEAGGALGPLYGALVTEHLGWKFIFILNVPLVIALIVAAWIFIPKGNHLRERIDWLGTILLGIALTCLSLGLAQQGASLGPIAPNSPAPQNNPIALALAVLFLVAFVLVERKVRWPVIDVSLFKRLPFSATSLVSLFVGAALIIAMADIPIFVDTVLQGQVLDSGLALMRLTVMIPIGAVLGGWLCSRITCRWTAVLGLLFTAAGFFLMSRWPIHVGWTQITISTVTAGLGFGLVIAPIGTTATNAVKARQTGMGSAVVTALRMVGMILGLAALTSWALAYFKELARAYPSLPLTATSAQFAAWSKGYATHLVQSAHTVYSAVFFVSMVLCLIALVPALFLWGSKQPVVELDEPDVPDELALAPATAVAATDASAELAAQDGQPPVPPGDDQQNGGKKGRNPKRRRLLFAIIGGVLVVLLIGGGVFAAFLFQDDSSDTPTPAAANGSATQQGTDATATPVAGPRRFQLALDKGALTSLFVSQLHLQQGALTDLNVTPVANDGLILSLNLHINANGINRVLPVELDGQIGLDNQKNLQLVVTHLKRDGQDAGPAAAANMQGAINQLLSGTLMPALRGQLKNVKLISVHTSNAVACGHGVEMLVLEIEAPPIQGIAAQPTPVPFCFTGSLDLNKLQPH